MPEKKQVANTPFIHDYINRIINGPAGFKRKEEHEFETYNDREVAISEFVIRCLGNPECEGGEEVLNAILRKRNKRSSTRVSFQSQRRSGQPYKKDILNYLKTGQNINFITARSLFGITKLDTVITILRNDIPVFEREIRVNNITCLEYSLKPL